MSEKNPPNTIQESYTDVHWHPMDESREEATWKPKKVAVVAGPFCKRPKPPSRRRRR